MEGRRWENDANHTAAVAAPAVDRSGVFRLIPAVGQGCTDAGDGRRRTLDHESDGCISTNRAAPVGRALAVAILHNAHLICDRPSVGKLALTGRSAREREWPVTLRSTPSL
jgi:hypothetical protein